MVWEAGRTKSGPAKLLDADRWDEHGESGTSVLFDAVGQLSDLVIDRAPFGHQLADLAVSVHHRGVVTTAKLLPNLRK